MKRFFNKYKHLTSLLAVTVLAFMLLHFAAALFVVGLWQLTQIAMSKRRGSHFYNTVLSPEQVKEFGDICKELGALVPGIKDLAGAQGGYAAIKELPNLLGKEQKRVDEIQGDVKKLRKQLATFDGPTGVKWIGNVPFVTDGCARSLTSVFVLETAKLGDSALRSLNRDANSHEKLIDLARGFLGLEQKAALTTTEIPVPTIYVPQIVELVFAYGQARQYATVFPLGAGTVKLPRLKAGEDDFGFLGVGTAGMSQSITEKKVTAELVTFTANKFGGLIRIPTELEEDTFVQLGQFLARYIARQMAKGEDKTLFLGDGTATYANITGVGPYCTANAAYLLQLDAAQTKVTDITLDNIRDLRGKVNAAVLSNMAAQGQTAAAYYCHPTMEPQLRKLNKYPNFIVYEIVNGKPYLDGWPVRWVGFGAVNDGAAHVSEYAMFFGDLSYWYLGERGSVRVEVSKEVFFATDELAMRALERIDVEAMAIDAMAAMKLGAGA